MEKLTTYERVFAERIEKGINSEAVLPDYLPRVGRIVRVSATTEVDRCECGEAIYVGGRVFFKVLYVPDYGEGLKCAGFPIDFEHRFGTKSARAPLYEKGFTECNAVPFSVNARLINPGKLALSCVLSLETVAVSEESREPFNVEETEILKKKTASAESLSITRVKGVDVRIDERLTPESTLPPVREVCHSECTFGTVRAEMRDGGCHFSGNARFYCLYLADTENEQYVSYEKEIPFTAVLDGIEASGECRALCCAKAVKVASEPSVNNYGDTDGLHVEIRGEITGRLYLSTVAEVCEDVFCTKYDCRVDVKPIPTDVYRATFSEDTEIVEKVRINLGDITEAISCIAELYEPHAEVVGGKIAAEATAQLRILGRNEQGGLESAEAILRVKYPMHKEFEADIEKYRLESMISCNGATCRIENGEVICTIQSHLDVACIADSFVTAVSAIELDDSREYIRDKSRYIIYYPDKEDSLWSVAKKYRTPPEKIMAANGLRDSSAIGKHCLVIPG